jgi:hypothetical protein
MRKLFYSSAFVTGMLLFACQQSKAISFEDLDILDQDLSVSGPSVYSSILDIAEHNFDPGLDTISSARVIFSLYDDNQNLVSQGFKIELDGQATSFSVIGEAQLNLNLLSSLNNDGILSYSVTATSGSFRLHSAQLIAEGSEPDSPTRNVPESGSTLVLGSLALLAFIAAHRRILHVS